MPKNTLYLLLGALVVVVIGLGVYVLREESKPEGVQIELNQDGLSIEQN
jgi:RsiW-degrading membrane proteinase PrsW (M82 family)